MKTKRSGNRYKPTMHALERVKLRLGVSSERAGDWFVDFMSKAEYVASSGKHRMVYEKDGVQAIVDNRNNAIVTIHAEVRIDFLRPVFEREVRKLRREGTRQIRMLERRLAEGYATLSKATLNYANACNPNTRRVIGETIQTINRSVSDLTIDIERKEDEIQAKIKAIEVLAE